MREKEEAVKEDENDENEEEPDCSGAKNERFLV
jgi:hypothetical protein